MLQVYTGNGKGKTTAAIGLAIRALGAGFKVYIMQFMKSLAYSEQKILRNLPGVKLETSGKPCFIAEEGTLDEETIKKFGDGLVIFPKGNPPKDYVELMEKGLEKVFQDAISGNYRLVILDEINMALYFGLLTRERVEALLNTVPVECEVVCTGRAAPQWLIDRADLVTDMQEVRHYYNNGVPARRGIED